MYLEPGLSHFLPESGDGFDSVMRLDGEVYRSLENRRTARISLGGRAYFLKTHRGVGWWEILRNLIFLRAPVLGARNEWRAIQRLQELGVDTPVLAGYGERGINPARKESFVLTEALENTQSLETLCAGWAENPPGTPEALRCKRLLISKIAAFARRMHRHGVNHRDFYLCHFLLEQPDACMQGTILSPRLYLIDLHRVQLRANTPERWRVKDIGSLYFSSMRIGLTRHDLYRFMRAYSNTGLRGTLNEDARFWHKVRLRAGALYQSFYQSAPPAYD